MTYTAQLRMRQYAQVACAAGPAESKITFTGDVINHNSIADVSVLMSLPAGVRAVDIDRDEPIVFYPGKVQSRDFKIIRSHGQNINDVHIIARFDRERCLSKLQIGANEVQVAGRFTSGRHFFGQSHLIIAAPLQWQRQLVPIGIAR